MHDYTVVDAIRHRLKALEIERSEWSELIKSLKVHLGYRELQLERVEAEIGALQSDLFGGKQRGPT